MYDSYFGLVLYIVYRVRVIDILLKVMGPGRGV
jgi:hypothetical protein